MASKPLVVGQWVGLCDPAVVEISALAGYDFAVIDLEHTMIDLQTVENMVRAAEATGIDAMVRIPSLDSKMILRILECGATGIWVPHVRSAQEVREIVSAARYWPEGNRGFSGVTRAAKYLSSDFMEHTKVSNKKTMIVAMIEEKEAVDQIDEILSVNGLDIAFIGPADLSQSLGVPGQKNHKKIIEAINHILETSQRIKNAQIGIAWPHSAFEEPLADLVSKGIRCITMSPTDTGLLLRASREQLKMAKNSLENLPA